ncbi:beta-xylosidase [Paraburkholderia sp. BCC1886]|uniref:beta-xylosidase n=1 Tax=Paraburkholderia sp. BCC1886 TaxID=2562670 RepID=UPI0021B26008|nr:beta-xylosidase [Paraburkholderia sp. BCC1886]
MDSSHSAGAFKRAFLRSFYCVTGLGVAWLGSTGAAFAQITQGNGSGQQENRTSAMGSAADPAASTVHESYKPQTKDGASAKGRGKTAGQGHKTQGAGGFENGLYGTGAGSNK